MKRRELHLSELNGIDRTSLALISPWSNLNLYIMSILETSTSTARNQSLLFFCFCNRCDVQLG